LRAILHTDIDPQAWLADVLTRIAHARLQIDAVRPQINVAARRQIARLPRPMFFLPLALQSRNHGRREVRGVPAKQGCQHFLEVGSRKSRAGQEPAQVRSGFSSAALIAEISPMKTNARNGLLGATISSLGLFEFDRPDHGLDRANRIMPLPNDALAPVGAREGGMRSHEGVDFRLDRLSLTSSAIAIIFTTALD